MRIVFWSGDSTLTIPWIDRRANTLLTLKTGWRAGLMELGTRLAAMKGAPRVGHFDIHCHGAPAYLAIPKGGDIDHTNVAEFGSLVKPMLANGAVIEILACSVASIDMDRQHVLDDLPASTTLSALTHEYWEALEKDQYFQINAETQRVAEEDLRKMRTFWFEKARSRQLAPDGNGLEFCRTLAASSGARVRAASMFQYFSRYAVFDAMGGWEGHVWDFFPAGNVKYIGFNPPRSVPMFSQRMDGALDINSRGQGVDNDDGRLRPQRLDRVPLPV